MKVIESQYILHNISSVIYNGFPKLKFHSKDINKSKLFQEAIVVYNTHEGIDFIMASRVILCTGIIGGGGEGGGRSQDFKTGLWTGNSCSVVWGLTPISFIFF